MQFFTIFVGLSDLGTEKVINMSMLFDGCKFLKVLSELSNGIQIM